MGLGRACTSNKEKLDAAVCVITLSKHLCVPLRFYVGAAALLCFVQAVHILHIALPHHLSADASVTPHSSACALSFPLAGASTKS